MSQILSTAKIPCTAAGCNFKTTRREYLKRHVKNHHQRPNFNCEFCDKLITTKVGWETHRKIHTGELLPCTVCDFKTPYVAHLSKHIERHELRNAGIYRPKRPNTHKCQLCGFLASSEARVVQHARVHSAELPFECSVPGCGHRTKWKANLKQHEDRHDPMKSQRFQCPMCPKRFCTDYQVTRHVRTHTQERTRECPDCDYRAASLVQVKRHQRRYHLRGARPLSQEVQKEDSECQREEMVAEAGTRRSLRQGLRPVKIGHHYSPPSSFENLEKHNDTEGQRSSSSVSDEPTLLDSPPSKTLDKGRKVKRKPMTVNPHPKKHVCSVCGYATSHNVDLEKHMRTHSDEKPFHCQAPNCTFQTRWAVSLEGHTKRLHTPKKYKCSIAGCDFKSKDLILSKKHRRLHKLPLKKNLQCPLCPKKFASKHGLGAHVVCHTGEKAFKCELCDYKGKTSYSVTYHCRRMHAQ